MPPGPDSPPPLVQAPLPALLSPYTDSGSSRSASPPECILAPLSATNEFLPVANYPLGMPSQSQYGDGSPTYQDESHGGVYSFENGHSHSQSAAVDSNVHSNGIQEQPYAYTNSYGNHHATPHISSSPVQALQHIDNPHASSASSPNQYSPVSSRHSISHISHPQAYSHSAPPYPPASLPPSPASAHSGSSHGSLASEPHTPVYTYQEIPEPNEYHSTDAGFGPISHTSSLPAEYYSSQNELVTNGFAAQLAPHVPGSYSHRYQPSPPILAPTQERLVHGEMQHAHGLAQSACMSISAPPAQSQLSPYLHHPRPMSGAPQYHLPHVSIQRPDWEKHSLVLPAIHN
jgi:zinc finger protein CreA/MIG